MSEEVGLSVDGGNSRRRLRRRATHLKGGERGVETGVACGSTTKFVQFTYQPARR